ncbi:MAG: ornithine--oxo-acid transaminase [Acidobacteriota bacterium]|nr:ornithine--oxo-acid transaminase [Acidobacteriota bacterium]
MNGLQPARRGRTREYLIAGAISEEEAIMITTSPVDIEARYAPNINPTYPVILHRAADCTVWDVDGKAYLDMLAGFSALNLGHGHPALIDALTDQAKRLTLAARVFHHSRSAPLLERLARFSGYEKALLMNSGAEAVETMVKAARRYGYRTRNIPEGRAEIIVFTGNFHGRTLGMISASSTPRYKEGYGPLLPGFRMVPYGDLEATRQAVTPDTCAVMLEAVQGRGGVVLPPDGFLEGVRQLCDETGILMLADEVQAGLGRTGYRFAVEAENVRADGVAIGKSLSGGIYPVSAFLADAPLMDVFTPGSHGSTFGGNPMACAVAEAALGVFEEEDLIARSHRLGREILPRLNAMKGGVVRDVRARGLWFALVIDPERGNARKLCRRLVDAGLLCDACPGEAIRFSPPLTITGHDLTKALDIMEEIMRTESTSRSE